MTERDRAILMTLALKVRLLSVAQIARTWWSLSASGQTETRKRLAVLTERGWLRRLRRNIHPELDLIEPVDRWEPPGPAPNFNALAHRLQSRWTGVPMPTTIIVASKKTAHHFGGAGGLLKQPHQVKHDMHVATVYLKILGEAPDDAQAWVSEDLVETHDGKVPDAMIQSPGEHPRLAIEFGSAASSNWPGNAEQAGSRGDSRDL